MVGKTNREDAVKAIVYETTGGSKTLSMAVQEHSFTCK
ncbi:hypothetical protein RJ641_016585 [Dillenia turbinata]|uniref:Uncharacterized protein n=1 Tax=Dillenia turbinata TaxID=194707 RepID=A0AAN8UYP6_9MAGN